MRVATDQRPSQPRYVETNPEAPENEPDKTDNFSARNQQAANEKVPEEHVQEQVNRLIQTLSRFSGRSMEAEWNPPIALWEGQNEVRILVDLPGVERDAVHVTLSRGTLELSGTRPLQHVEDVNPLKLRYAEHPYGKFRRTMPLPHGARVEQMKAEMRAGVLELRIPKEAEIVEVKTVTVG